MGRGSWAAWAAGASRVHPCLFVSFSQEADGLAKLRKAASLVKSRRDVKDLVTYVDTSISLRSPSYSLNCRGNGLHLLKLAPFISG